MSRRSIGMGAWLAAGSAAIVLLAVLAVASSSTRLLGRLAQEQAITRVELAGASAREYLRRVNDELLSDVRVLADRPTLVRLLGQRNVRDVRTFIQRYVITSGLSACAVFDGESLLTAVGDNISWAEVQAALAEQGERFIVASRETGLLLSGASAPVSRRAGVSVLALRVIDEKMIADMRAQIGAEVRVTNYATYAAPPEDPFTDLHTQAMSRGAAVARRMKATDVYAAAVPWYSVAGELIGLIDVEISATEFDASVRALAWRLVLIAMAVLAVAALGGMTFGRWLIRPLQALRDAADHIGRGDFSVAVPSTGISEVESLALTMEEMRRNLINLTTALRHRDAESRAMLAGVVEGVYAVDADRVIRYANDQVTRMLGRKPDEIIGRFCGDVLRPGATDGVRPCERDCPILAARTSGQSRAAERLCMDDGSLRSVVIVSAAPTDGQQVQVLRDETELEAVRRARDGVLANISHEFRTPLAAQLASIELLRDGIGRLAPGEQRELVESLQRGVLRLMRLIDNLLESVRIESGQVKLREQTIRLQEIAEEAAALVRPLLEQRRQTISMQWPESLPTLIGDSQRLVQVFVNLLANASKFGPEGSTIRIGGEQRGERVAAWVEDEGTGLSATSSSVIFERFGRADDIEPDAPGLGLGLWIVRSIIERHGGEVGVERTEENRTRFFIALPLRDWP